MFLAVRKYREDQTSHIHGPDQVRSQKFYNLSLKPQSHKDFLPSRKNVLPHPPLFVCRNGRLLGVCASVDNCRLFVGGIPKTKKREEILAEMKKVTEGVVDVIVYPSAADKTRNRGFAFVEYESHRTAAMARRKLLPGKHPLLKEETAPHPHCATCLPQAAVCLRKGDRAWVLCVCSWALLRATLNPFPFSSRSQ